MAGSVNKVILVGALGRDPEIKSFQNGGRVCNMSLATSESWKDRTTGERKERTEWHNVTLNGDGLIGVAERFLRKGSKVYIEGQLRTRKWQDRNGQDRYTTEIVVSGFNGSMVMLSKNEGNGGQGGGAQGQDDGWGGGSTSGGSSRSSGSRGGRFGQDYGGELGGGEWGSGGGVDATGRSTGGGYGDELDDDIPF